MDGLSHHDQVSDNLPNAEASSTYRTCVTLVDKVSSLWTSGMVVRMYIGIARGSPWVVPSSEYKVS